MHISMRSHIVVLLLSAFFTWNATVFAVPPASKEKTPEAPKNLIGSTVDLQLTSGKTLQGVVIEEAVPGKLPGSYFRLKISGPKGKTLKTFSAAAIKQVSMDGVACLVYDAKSKSLISPEQSQPPVMEKAAHTSGKQGKAAQGRGKKTDAAPVDPAEEAARRERNAAKREEFHKKTGVWLWPELTDEQKQEELAKNQEFIRKVTERYPSLKMQLHETKYFLFLSDLSPQVASVFTSCLDEMHEQLCVAFGVEDKNKVWLGKVPVIAFANTDSFKDFEKEFFKIDVDPRTIQGLAHQSTTGEVVIGCHCGKDPYYFAGVIVHETTHGFVHRYLSSTPLPSWLNEGIAEWTAMNVVTKDQGIKQKAKNAVTLMRQSGTMGGNFFTAEHIAPTQYGIATRMTDFLLRSDPKAFRMLIEGIKLGEGWENALQKSYGVTPEQLTQQFGKSIGIPMLRP